jgi:heme-degrading monooxygenase HmoA
LIVGGAGKGRAMSVVKINAITVPKDKQERFEERFRGRGGHVEKTPGFEWFELLRPLEGTDQYLVYTRWSSEEAPTTAGVTTSRPRPATRITSGPTRCWSPPGRTTARAEPRRRTAVASRPPS